jgi:hypothetical protein
MAGGCIGGGGWVMDGVTPRSVGSSRRASNACPGKGCGPVSGGAGGGGKDRDGCGASGGSRCAWAGRCSGGHTLSSGDGAPAPG